MRVLVSIFTIGLIIVLFGCNTQKTNKVLIIGIDGCKPDVLEATISPNIDKLVQNGCYTYQAKTDPISSSGICWTSMLTGVWHEKHNVTSNAYKNPNIAEFPHIFKRIKEKDPSLKTYSIVNWEPIHKIIKDGEANVVETYSPDEKVTEQVVNVLQNDNPDILFVQLDDVDHAGHEFDYKLDSPGYVKAIQVADKQVGLMVDAVRQRKTYAQENWLILVSTDHGGSNFGHGKDIPEHTTIFYIASGESAKKGELNNVNVVDVAVTALHHLGIKVKQDWNLDGKVKGVVLD